MKLHSTNFADLTEWIPTSEANERIKKFIADGLYTKDELKKSSQKWADNNDHSKGYLCRVMGIKGKHSELEIIATAKRGRKATKPVVEKKAEIVEKKEVPAKKLGTYLVDIERVEGGFRKLYALEDDSQWWVSEVVNGETFNTERMAPQKAMVVFYGSVEEANKHIWPACLSA